MSEEVLHEKVSYIVDKVEDIESLITRRLLEDKAKNSLIEELKQYLIYRQDLDKGEKFAPFMKQILQVIDNSGMIDPSMHEVVNTVAVTDEQSENNIVEVLQKGYLLNNRVLRPSKVTIAK